MLMHWWGTNTVLLDQEASALKYLVSVIVLLAKMTSYNLADWNSKFENDEIDLDIFKGVEV